MPDTFRPDPLGEHCRLVGAVVSIGGMEPPEAWTQLRQRFADFVALNSDTARPLHDRLVAAVVDGPPDAYFNRSTAHQVYAVQRTFLTTRARHWN